MNDFLDMFLSLAFPIFISKSYIFYLLNISKIFHFHCHLPDSNFRNLLPRPGISRQPMSQMWAAAYFVHSFVGTQTYAFAYMSSRTAFRLQVQSWVVATERLAKPKLFSKWPFTEKKFAGSYLDYRSAMSNIHSRLSGKWASCGWGFPLLLGEGKGLHPTLCPT